MEGLGGGDGGDEQPDEAGACTGRTMAFAGLNSEEIVKYEAVVVCSVVQDRNSHLNANHSRANSEDVADHAQTASQHVDVVRFLLESFEAAGLKVQILQGMDHKVFIKVAATETVIGRAAETLQLKKLTNLGLQTVFDWELRDSFMRQPHDQALFSWTERYYLLHYIIHSLKLEASVEVQFEFTNSCGTIACVALAPGVAIMSSLEEAGLVVDIFPSHDEQTRKDLLHEWSLNWSGGTSQPLDAIYSYFGPKIALYFAFLEMYTNWLIFPAVTGTLYFLVDLGKWSPVIPPLSAVTMVGITSGGG